VELQYSAGGITHKFVDVDGAAYVKVTDYRDSPPIFEDRKVDSTLRRLIDAAPVKLVFVEHVHVGILFISYFGVVDQFEPPKKDKYESSLELRYR